MKLSTVKKICKKYGLVEYINPNDVHYFSYSGCNIITWSDDFIPVEGEWPDTYFIGKNVENGIMHTQWIDYKYGTRNLLTTKDVEENIIECIQHIKTLNKQLKINTIRKETVL